MSTYLNISDKIKLKTVPFGLLDIYSGAAAAYSLRPLSLNYTGDAIVVTTNGSDSASIGFVNNELDTASLEAFANGGDAYVSVWYDQSGNGNNATQTSFSAMPKIVSAGTSLGYIENKTSGSNQALQSTFSYSSALSFSAFMVVQNFGNAVFGGTNNGSKYYAVAQSSSTLDAQVDFDSISYYNNGSSIGTTRNDIYNATSSFAELTTLARAGSTNTMWLGYDLQTFNNSRIKEYIIYDNQSVSRTGVENNIITYYGF